MSKKFLWAGIVLLAANSIVLAAGGAPTAAPEQKKEAQKQIAGGLSDELSSAAVLVAINFGRSYQTGVDCHLDPAFLAKYKASFDSDAKAMFANEVKDVGAKMDQGFELGRKEEVEDKAKRLARGSSDTAQQAAAHCQGMKQLMQAEMTNYK